MFILDMKKIMIFLMLLICSAIFTYAAEDFTEAKSLIDSKVSCAQLSEDQLELIGDYLMEQMHPGEAHELMDQAMGGEGSESLRSVHIKMARSIYCGEGGMMGMMGMGNMMGIQNQIPYNTQYNMMGNNIYSGAYKNTLIRWIFGIIIFAILVGLAFFIWINVFKSLKHSSKK